jgi:nicotinamidase/pyrazinamidase
VKIDPETSALIVVDVQPDFLPGGALAVPEGDEILHPLQQLMGSGYFAIQVATQDWHPPDHVSFASRHDGSEPMEVIPLHGHHQKLWPDHCVQETHGAMLHPELPWHLVDAIIRKGTDADSDSYSGFRNNWAADGERPSTGLAGLLRDRGVRRIYCAGLARDVCVRWTARDGVDEGFDVAVLWDLTRPVDDATDDEVRSELEELGVAILDSSEAELSG